MLKLYSLKYNFWGSLTIKICILMSWLQVIIHQQMIIFANLFLKSHLYHVSKNDIFVKICIKEKPVTSAYHSVIG